MVVVLLAVAVFAGVVPVSARIMIDDGGGDDGGGDVDCLRDISVWFTAEPAEVTYGEFTTLSWQVILPLGCPAMTYSINSIGEVDQSGSQVVQVTESQALDSARTDGRRAIYSGPDFGDVYFRGLHDHVA